MGRHASDPVLHQLANELKDIEFDHDDGLRLQAEELLQNNDLNHIYLMKDAKTFAVRLFIGGRQRVIGLTEDLTAACRFADMARMRFWIYRTRDAREPVESDLHFGVQQAKEDLANHLQAQHLLDKIELHLKETEVIDPFIKPNDAKERAKARDERRTVRDELNARFGALEDRLDAICDYMRETQSYIRTVGASLESFKRSRFTPAHVDIEDAEVVMSSPEQSNMSTQEAQQITVTPIGVNASVEDLFVEPSQPIQ